MANSQMTCYFVFSWKRFFTMVALYDWKFFVGFISIIFLHFFFILIVNVEAFVNCWIFKCLANSQMTCYFVLSWKRFFTMVALYDWKFFAGFISISFHHFLFILIVNVEVFVNFWIFKWLAYTQMKLYFVFSWKRFLTIVALSDWKYFVGFISIIFLHFLFILIVNVEVFVKFWIFKWAAYSQMTRNISIVGKRFITIVALYDCKFFVGFIYIICYHFLFI